MMDGATRLLGNLMTEPGMGYNITWLGNEVRWKLEHWLLHRVWRESVNFTVPLLDAVMDASGARQ